MRDGGSEGPIVADRDEPAAAGHLDEDGPDVGWAGARWAARWLTPGRVAWISFLVIAGGLTVVGAPIRLAMIPAAVCAGVNLVLLRSDERLRRPQVPDHVPAAWSGIRGVTGQAHGGSEHGDLGPGDSGCGDSDRGEGR